MATEIAHEPAAARQALDIKSGADAISGILNRPEETPETSGEPPQPQEIKDEGDLIELQPEEDTQVEEPVEVEETTETVEAKDKPATDEDEVTSEIELDPAQVAQLYGLDENDIEVDDDNNIFIHTKVDGKPAKASLKDLRHSYELAQTHEERLRELGRERKAFEEESQSILENLSNQQQQFALAVQALEDEYASDFQSVDWTRLRNENPTEYVAKKQDYEDRKSRITEYKARLNHETERLKNEYDQRIQKQQQDGARRLEEVFQGSNYKSAPKWDQPEMERLSKWIMDQGFSADDISQVAVWQVFKWARDSMLRESELKQAQEAVKKVTKLPKIVKPGKPKARQEVKKSKVKDAKDRQRKSGGDLKATTELIRQIVAE